MPMCTPVMAVNTGVQNDTRVGHLTLESNQCINDCSINVMQMQCRLDDATRSLVH